MIVRSSAVLLTLLALGACDESVGSVSPAGSADSPSLFANAACLDAVRTETGNPDVVVLESLFSEAGTLVTVGVGSDAVPWECLSSNNGIVESINYVGGEEGLL